MEEAEEPSKSVVATNGHGVDEMNGIESNGIDQNSGSMESKRHGKDESNGNVVHESIVVDESNGGGVDEKEDFLDITTVSWFRQLQVVLRKNFLLLSRRPIILLVMLVSPMLSVLLAWAAGRDSEYDFGDVELTDCGTVSSTFYQNQTYDSQYYIPLSYNDNWRSGLPVTVMALGPMVTAIASFFVVHEEISSQMLGVLRGLGLRESVFWASWWIPFFVISLINSLLGAAVAQAIDVHVFQNVYFGGVFLSLWFLQLALIGCSLFCAALLSTSRRGASWFVLIMIVAVWIPFFLVNAKSGYVSNSASGLSQTPTGLFWVNANTTWYSYIDNTACDKPLISEEEGKNYKTVEEREAQSSSPEEFFMGCYFGAGYTSYMWNEGAFGTKVVGFLFPYTQFLTIWSNFLGYTGMPGRRFESQHASMSPEELAVASLPVPQNEANAKGTSLYPQGSTFSLQSFYLDAYDFDEDARLDNCPAQNASEYFCPDINQCVSALNPAPTPLSPSLNQMIGYLLALSALYTLVAAYWAQVFPGSNGAPQKFYFFLLPSYWFGSRTKKSTESKTNSAGVAVKNIRKQYGDFEALKGVSLHMERGEVTALLGHNGAGKTTLAHVLSCEILPTGGDVSVFGHSVTTDPYAVRRLVGVCKQDDYLYPDLSAKEHLELFAGLGGVPHEKMPEVVQKWLESVDLATVQNQFSASFSGGMKRRLSLACSTIGDRPCIVLDEPTTGMDPISRRFVWKHIDEIKEGRVVLLTTHAMEEADLLSDTVAVMRKGELAAFGTPLELKSEYGSALQFSLLVERDTASAMKKAILKRFADSHDWVAVDAGDAGNITVKFQRVRQGNEGEGVDVEQLADFVSWLERDESGVSEYGFSNSSLEEVFLTLTEDGDERENEQTDELDVCCTNCCTCCIGCCLSGPCRCCCCPRPRQHASGHLNESPERTDEVNQSVDQAAEPQRNRIATFQPVLTVRRQAGALFRFSFARNWSGKGSIGNWIIYTLLVLAILVVGIFAAGAYDTLIPAMTAPTASLSLLLLNIVGPIYLDRQRGLFYMMRTQGLLKRGYILGTCLYSFTITFVYGFIALSLLYATPMFRDPIICSIDSYDCYHQEIGPPVLYPVAIGWWNDEFNGQPVELYAVPTAGGYGRVFGTAFFFALTMPGAALASSYIPGYKFALVCVVFIVLFVSFLPFGFYITRSPFQSYESFEQCGWDICNTTLSSINILNLGSNSEEFLNCVGLDVHQSGYSLALGSLCIPPVASILPQFGLFQSLTMTLIGEIIFVSDPPEYVEQVLVPSLSGDVNCSGNTCVFPYSRWYYGVTLGFMALGAVVLLFLGIAQVSFFAFPDGVMLRIRNQMSHALDHLRCGKTKRKKTDEQKLDEAACDEAPLEEVVEERQFVDSLAKPLVTPAEPEFMEEGGAESMQVVVVNHDAIPREDLPPVLMYKLRKVYPSLGGLPPKVALNSLDLHVPKGQVLGLLGKNGAGKTTALKILAVSHDASAGLALVAGYDVSCERVSVFERLGNRPQFDLVWPKQSVRGHLEFFAKLKGLPRNKVQEIALSIATAVGLGSPEVFRRPAGDLSGGMRRRLSIAISLIGAPSVLLLDEPSTGLDPSTRNSIWGLINSFATEERAIIITTHMMIEADTLCSRIAIVSRGHLKVVATQQHLKDRFGSGYLLQLNLIKSTPENQESAISFVRKRLHKHAVLQIKQAKTLHIALPRDVNLTEVFRALYSAESSTEGRINQFLLSQSSLEDVFIALGD